MPHTRRVNCYSYDLTLEPGETGIVMHFASQNPDQATALRACRNWPVSN